MAGLLRGFVDGTGEERASTASSKGSFVWVFHGRLHALESLVSMRAFTIFIPKLSSSFPRSWSIGLHIWVFKAAFTSRYVEYVMADCVWYASAAVVLFLSLSPLCLPRSPP